MEECRGSTTLNFAAAPDHLHDFLAGGVRGAGVGWSSDPLGLDSLEGDETASAGGEGEIDQLSLPLLDQFLSVDGMLDSHGASVVSLAVTQQSRHICEGCRSRHRRRRDARLHATSSTESRGRTARSTSAAEAEVEWRGGAESAKRCCCSQPKSNNSGAMQSSQAEGSQAHPAGKQRRHLTRCRE